MTGKDHINYHYIISLPVLDGKERVISDTYEHIPETYIHRIEIRHFLKITPPVSP